jgi:hypothetical protein
MPADLAPGVLECFTQNVGRPLTVLPLQDVTRCSE